jgi:hypothetical protein
VLSVQEQLAEIRRVAVSGRGRAPSARYEVVLFLHACPVGDAVVPAGAAGVKRCTSGVLRAASAGASASTSSSAEDGGAAAAAANAAAAAAAAARAKDSAALAEEEDAKRRSSAHHAATLRSSLAAHAEAADDEGAGGTPAGSYSAVMRLTDGVELTIGRLREHRASVVSADVVLESRRGAAQAGENASDALDTAALISAGQTVREQARACSGGGRASATCLCGRATKATSPDRSSWMLRHTPPPDTLLPVISTPRCASSRACG